jgi:hypothetical protein
MHEDEPVIALFIQNLELEICILKYEHTLIERKEKKK